MQRYHTNIFISGKWLIVLTVAFLIIGLGAWTFRPLGLSQQSVLAILALLAGFIYAFTNANDQRVLAKRLILVGEEYVASNEDTSGFLRPKEFIALGGTLGALFTWALQPIIYYSFSFTSSRPIGDLLADLSRAASLSFLGIPSFLCLGALSIVATLSYLEVVSKSLLHLVFPTIAITGLTVLGGAILFEDSLAGSQFLVPLLLACFVVFVLSKHTVMTRKCIHDRQTIQGTTCWKSSLSSWVALIVFVSAEVARSLLLRNTLKYSSISNQFFVAICLRSLYFSTFFLYAVICLYKNRARILSKSLSALIKANSNRIRIVLVTTTTFVCAFAISTPTFAFNLALSPVLFAAAQIMAFPVLEAYYCNGGTEVSPFERLFQVFGKYRSDGRLEKVFFVSNVFSYVFAWSMCIFWVCVQFP